jgi:protein-S-isoprenylcysteine O-methyltransferase Ste14
MWMPVEVERHFYVMWSGFFLLMVGALWHREQQLLLDLRGTWAGWAMLGISCLGWLVLLSAGVSMDALELVGLRQLQANLRGRPLAAGAFKAPGLYRYVRHPLYLGLIIGFWASPCHTVDSLLFAAAMTGYIYIGIHFEEKDLRSRMGDQYAQYAKQVPKLFPWFGKRYRGGSDA